MAHNYERNEYPRPQFARKIWKSLNGEWALRFDDAEEGARAGLAERIQRRQGDQRPVRLSVRGERDQRI